VSSTAPETAPEPPAAAVTGPVAGRRKGAGAGRYVGVVGAGDCSAEQAAAAEEVGRRVAATGAVVVCGGLGGVMEAACRGAWTAGGTTVGLLPGVDRSAANHHLTAAIATGLGEARNVLVVAASDVLVAVGGGYGTLAEVALALKTGKPVVGLGSWELPGVTPAPDPEGAVEVVLQILQDR
jgi:uncharacterized protein (TIGR00725 family)